MDAQARVIVTQAGGGLRHVELADLIKHFGIRFRNLHAVGEHFGNVERAAVARGQLDANVLQVSGRIWSQVNDDIVNRASRAADEFNLRMRSLLEMHSADGTLLATERDTALNELIRQVSFPEFPSAESSREKPARVFERLRFHDDSPRKFCLDEFQNFTRTASQLHHGADVYFGDFCRRRKT
jgi:hypothetical protein